MEQNDLTSEGGRQSNAYFLKWLALYLAIAIGVRLVWFSRVDTQPVTDFDWYFERAREIAAGLGYSVDGSPTAYWPVGYPAALSLVFRLFGASVLVGKVFNTFLVLGSITLSAVLARGLFKDSRVGLGVAGLLAIHPAFVAYSGILASEPLYTFLTLLCCVLCLAAEPGRWRLITAGMVFGLTVLVRPQALLLPLLVLGCFWLLDQREGYRGKMRVSVSAVLLGVVLVVAPWTVRNAIVLGKPVLVSTNGGDNLLIGNNPLADGKYHNPLTLGVDLANYDEVDRDRVASAAAVAYIKAHVPETVALWPTKIRTTFLSATDAPYWAFQKTKGVLTEPGKGGDKSQFKRFREYSIQTTAWLLGLAAFGVIAGLFTRKLPLLGLAFVAYSILLSMIFFGNPRFAFAVIPFIAMHAVHGLLVVWDRRPSKPKSAATAESQSS